MKREQISLWALPAAVMLFSWLVQPRVGVTDCDAENYLMGVRSLRAGLGYIDTAGNHLNHWPVGYSAMLSLFQDPLWGAWLINLFSLGLAAIFVQLLAARASWPLWSRMSLALILCTGFLAHLGHVAKPDVLSYALFLAAVYLYSGGRMGGRFTGLALCALLIPIKLIAVTFAPALLFGDLVDLKPAAFFRDRWREVVLGLLLWSLGFGAVLLHNHYSLQGVTPESYISSSVEMMMGEIKRFCGGFFRQGVAIWYGSIRNWWVLVPFCLVAALGLGCLATMVRNGAGRRLLIIGSAVFGMSWMMELYRVYYAGPRLMGYGMVLMLLGAVPRPRFAVLWISYTTAVALLTGYNFATVNSVGLNAPMYEQAAKEVATVLPSTPAVIHTNTWHLLDVHAGRASALAPNVDALPSGSLFWHVDLPNYDAIARIITDQTPPNWPMIGKLEHGGLYQKP